MRVTPSTALPPMAQVVVERDAQARDPGPQGKAVTGALNRLGFGGVSVRVRASGSSWRWRASSPTTGWRQVRQAAETLLANTVIETFDVRVEARNAT